MTKNSSFETAIELDDGEMDVTVEYSFSPGTPGTFYTRNGDPGEPGDPAECEILAVYPSNADVTANMLESLRPELVDTLIQVAYDVGVEEIQNEYEAALEAREEDKLGF